MATATKTEGTKGTKKEAARKRCPHCGKRVYVHKLKAEHGIGKCVDDQVVAIAEKVASTVDKREKEKAAKQPKKKDVKQPTKKDAAKASSPAPSVQKDKNDETVKLDMGLGNLVDSTRGAAERMIARAKKNGSSVPVIVDDRNGKPPVAKKPEPKAKGKRPAKSQPVQNTTPAPVASEDMKSAFDAALAAAKPKPRKTAKREGPPRSMSDPRMPPVGTVIESKPIPEFGGEQTVTVEVAEMGLVPKGNRPDGQPWAREIYKSPTAVIREARGRNTSDGLNGWWWMGFETSTGRPSKKDATDKD